MAAGVAAVIADGPGEGSAVGEKEVTVPAAERLGGCVATVRTENSDRASRATTASVVAMTAGRPSVRGGRNGCGRITVREGESGGLKPLNPKDALADGPNDPSGVPVDEDRRLRALVVDQEVPDGNVEELPLGNIDLGAELGDHAVLLVGRLGLQLLDVRLGGVVGRVLPEVAVQDGRTLGDVLLVEERPVRERELVVLRLVGAHRLDGDHGILVRPADRLGTVRVHDRSAEDRDDRHASAPSTEGAPKESAGGHRSDGRAD